MSFRKRYNGFICSHYKAQTPIDSSLVVSASSIEAVKEQVRQLLRRANPPTAFVAANDSTAYYISQVCHSMEINIPRDVSLVGFDDSIFSSQSSPALTTVRVEKELLGRIAVRRLYAKVTQPKNSPAVDAPVYISLPVSLILRDSCAPIRS